MGQRSAAELRPALSPLHSRPHHATQPGPQPSDPAGGGPQASGGGREESQQVTLQAEVCAGGHPAGALLRQASVHTCAERGAGRVRLGALRDRVRAPRAGPACQAARGGAAAPRTGFGAPHWKRWGWAPAACLHQRRRGPSSWDMRLAGQRGSSAVPRSGRGSPPTSTVLSFRAGPGGTRLRAGPCFPGSAT